MHHERGGEVDKHIALAFGFGIIDGGDFLVAVAHGNTKDHAKLYPYLWNIYILLE